MDVPIYEEFYGFLTEEKKMSVPDTFYGKYEYIRDYFLAKPFNEYNLKRMFSTIRGDLYYRSNEKSYAQTLNEYISITKLISEYNGFLKKQAGDVINVGSVEMSVTWEQMRAHYYIKKHNRSSEVDYRGKFNEIQQYFNGKPFNQDNINAFFTHLKVRFLKDNGREISTNYYNKFFYMLRLIAHILNINVLDDYEGVKENYVETHTLTGEEIQKLIDVDVFYISNTIAKNHRWKTIIKTLLVTTARPGELRNVKWDDLKGNYLHFKMTKNGSSHKVYIPDNLLKDIKMLEKHDHNFIFGSYQGALDDESLNVEIGKRCELAGIKKHITSRSMRATGITMYLKDNPIHRVARISNHREISVIMKHYYKPENDEIAKIVRRNEVVPDDPLPQEIVEEYKKISSRYINTKYADLVKEAEQLVENKLLVK